MSAYVDPAVWRWRGTLWCHLSADTLDELHAFAQSIGLRREWFQCPPSTKYPHYDLIASRRRVALQRGAISISSRELLAKAQRLLAQLPVGHASPDHRGARSGAGVKGAVKHFVNDAGLR